MDPGVIGDQQIDLAGDRDALGAQCGGDDPAQQPLMTAGAGHIGGKTQFVFHLQRRLP